MVREENNEQVKVYLALQWVHGRRTVVRLAGERGPEVEPAELQWVHGRRTVVRVGEFDGRLLSGKASMGPRSENRG